MSNFRYVANFRFLTLSFARMHKASLQLCFIFPALAYFEVGVNRLLGKIGTYGKIRKDIQPFMVFFRVCVLHIKIIFFHICVSVGHMTQKVIFFVFKKGKCLGKWRDVD